MISHTSVRPTYLGSRPAIHTQRKSTHILPKLYRNHVLISHHHGSGSLISVIALNFSPRNITTASAASSSGDSSYGKPINDSLLRSVKDNEKQAFNFKTFIQHFFRRALAAAAVLSSLALALVSITPMLVSHSSGLSTALRLVNATIPAVTVEVASVKAGWRRPLEIRNIKILEKKISSNESTGTLVEVEKIKTTASLLDLAVLGRASDIIVAQPRVNMTVNSNGNLRVLQALQDAGVAPLPRQSHGKLLSSTSTTTTAAISSPSISTSSSSSSSSLQHVSITSIPFSGEIRAGNIHVALTSGQFLAPTEFQELFSNNKNNKAMNSTSTHSSGRSSGNTDASITRKKPVIPEIHFEVLMGGDTIEEEAKLEEQSAGFVTPGIGQQNQSQEEESLSSIADWARHKPSASEVPSDVGYLMSPMAVRVDSSAFKCILSGWRTSRGYTYLASPLEAEVRLTPKLAQVLVNRLNPLLGDAVELRGSSKITASVMPSDRIWPSATSEVNLNPLRVNIGQGAVISRGLEVLKLANKKIGAATRAATLQVDVSPLKAEIGADGRIVTKRVDLAVGVPGLGQPLKLVTYGTAHTSPAGGLDMTLAIPSESLELAGITGLPEDFGVPITVTGTVASPKIDVVNASKEIALLLIEQKAKKVGPRSAEWMWQELQLGGNRTKFRIPEE